MNIENKVIIHDQKHGQSPQHHLLIMSREPSGRVTLRNPGPDLREVLSDRSRPQSLALVKFL